MHARSSLFVRLPKTMTRLAHASCFGIEPSRARTYIACACCLIFARKRKIEPLFLLVEDESEQSRRIVSLPLSLVGIHLSSTTEGSVANRLVYKRESLLPDDTH